MRTSENVTVNLGPIDWQRYAQQKEWLVRMAISLDDHDHVAWGLVELFDRLEDEAEKQGHPVYYVR
jgi:hypothetical protein